MEERGAAEGKKEERGGFPEGEMGTGFENTCLLCFGFEH